MNDGLKIPNGSVNPSLNFETGTIWNADNLDVMRGMNSSTVDLIYLDPPFNSARNYNGSGRAKNQKFLDNWNEEQLKEWNVWEGVQNDADLLRDQNWWPMMELVKKKHSKAMYFYLSFMAVRLLQMKRILKKTGSLYLHCDDNSNSYLRMLLDYIFGYDLGPGTYGHGAEITWRRTTSSNRARRRYGRIADTIYVFRKSENYTHNAVYTSLDEEYIRSKYRYDDNDGRGLYSTDNLTAPGSGYKYDYKGFPSPVKGWRCPEEKMRELDQEGRLSFPKTEKGRIRQKRYLSESKGVPVSSIWTDIKVVNSQAKERTGWETQKPKALLNRIIDTSSNPGDVVFDPFCGCSTTLIAALERPDNEKRHVVGCDIDSEVCQVMDLRVSELKDRKTQDLFRNVEIKVLDCLNDRSLIPVRTDKTDVDDPPTDPVRVDVRKIYGTTLYGEQKGYCPGCKRHVEFDFMDVDHKLPLKRGGTNDFENLQMLCRNCNSKKGAKTMDEWLASEGALDISR